MQALTGSTQASVLEQSLAVYRALLEEGARAAGKAARRSSRKGGMRSKAKGKGAAKRAPVVQESLGPLFET